MMLSKEHWIDTRLNKEEMDFLRDAISSKNKLLYAPVENVATPLANITKSELIADNDNWFYKNVLKKYSERMFCDDWDNYRKYHIIKEQSLPKFEMERFWVNYQYQYEFNPLHYHTGLFSFVVFMKIPTHWKEQHETRNEDKFRARVASDFVFVWSGGEKTPLFRQNFPLSSEDEGRMLFFPAWLDHQVFPFYGTEKDRITISGNISFSNDPNKHSAFINVEEGTYEEKEFQLRMMETDIESMKKELEVMKNEKK